MTKEKLYEALGEVKESSVASCRSGKKRPGWIKWTAAAACLAIIAAAGIPLLDKGFDDNVLEPIFLIEYNGSYYESVDDRAVLKRLGVKEKISPDIAGAHVTYLQHKIPEDKTSYLIESSTPTDIELLEYSPAPSKGALILRDGDDYSAAVFCNRLIPDDESLPVTDIFEVYGVFSPEDIVSVTPVKKDDKWTKSGPAVTDEDLIAMFYSTITSLTPSSEDEHYEAVFGGVEEEFSAEAHAAYADDHKSIVIEAANGLRFKLGYYPSYGWLNCGAAQSYYKMSASMSRWFEEHIG